MPLTHSHRTAPRRRTRTAEPGAFPSQGTQLSKRDRQPADRVYLVTMAALISIGTIMVYSATALDQGTAQLVRMAAWLGLGAAGCLAGVLLPMRFWRRFAPGLLVVTLILLVSLLVPGNPLAVTANGATRWIGLPGGGTMQPSEFAKLAFVLFAAGMLERRRNLDRKDWAVFLGVLGLFAILIYKEPDLGTTLALGGTAFCMLIAAGVNWRQLVALFLTAVVVVGAAAWSTEHQRQRLLTWWNPWEYRLSGGMQTIMSWDAMARGGITGVGLGNSRAKLDNRLPEAETDFIFAVLAEELGLVGSLAVVLLFGLLSLRGYSIAARAPDRYSGLVAAGITSWIAVQAFLNIAVATGTVPNTGVPLPFISSGGTSLVTVMTASGIVLGVSRRARPARRKT